MIKVNLGVDLLRNYPSTKTSTGGVSDKIQALLTTLSRPNKEHPSDSEIINYDDTKNDTSSPRPVGTLMQPAVGPVPELSGQAPSLDEQISKHAHSLKKVTAITCLDLHAKPSYSLTYEKLFQKVGFSFS
ncbi:Disco-interacting protein 2-like protein B-A-like [Oopsacas minuta]|uniref:Disco-interacting protein 2-like protein B-A-like n=1 Tax=Oopsacas minuta TaxID=111878 RepID=A0AAV7KIN4_9METZ|nr:Disco-interacting protein 2-like protein B-A-like [Oopsacas minuta]